MRIAAGQETEEEASLNGSAKTLRGLMHTIDRYIFLAAPLSFKTAGFGKPNVRIDDS
jgi:hypothetical protein